MIDFSSVGCARNKDQSWEEAQVESRSNQDGSEWVELESQVCPEGVTGLRMAEGAQISFKDDPQKGRNVKLGESR